MNLFSRWTKDGPTTGRREKDERTAAKITDVAQHQELLERAAGVLASTLVCRLDTWKFIVRNTPNESVFTSLRGSVADERGLMHVDLSPDNLLMLLSSMHRKLDGRHPSRIKARAAMVYTATAQVVNEATANDEIDIPDIVIDDNIGPSPAH